MVNLVRIRWIIIVMKRSSVIIGAFGLVCVAILVPINAQAVSPSPTPLATATVPIMSTPTPPIPLSKSSAKAAAHQAFLQAQEQAQNGSDLAFADAKATFMQAIATAGKDRIAKKTARDAYKVSTTQIVAAYKAAIAEARQAFKVALASINGK